MATMRDRQHWLWVTGPEYYLEYDGSDRYVLQPGAGVQGEWTCHRDTRKGDLIVLYRTQPMSDMAYLIEAMSDSYPMPEDVRDFGSWEYGCDYRVLRKLRDPLTLRELKADRVMNDWGVIRGNPRQQMYQVPDRFWLRLMTLIEKRDPGVAPILTRKGATTRTTQSPDEAWLEDSIARRPTCLRQVGFTVTSLEQQIICGTVGRLDLLCRTEEAPWLVVELKARHGLPQDVSQLAQYVSWVQDEFAGRRKVAALLVTTGFPDKVRAAARQMPGVRLATWEQTPRGSVRLQPA